MWSSHTSATNPADLTKWYAEDMELTEEETLNLGGIYTNVTGTKITKINSQLKC